MNDETLIKMAKDGDQEAINLIIDRYQKIIDNNARDFYLVGGENEDLFQEGSLGLLKAIKAYDDEKIPFKNFAIICIRRNILSAIKAAHTQKNAILNNALSVDDLKNSQGEQLKNFFEGEVKNPEELVIEKENLKEFIDFIKKNLSEAEFLVYEYLIRGYTYKEIANILDKNPKAIDNAIQRIKRKVEKWLENK